MIRTSPPSTHLTIAQIEQSLERIDPIGLEQLKSAALLDRVDTKYILTLSQLPALLGDLAPHYRVLCVNQTRLNHYQTVYFDTPCFAIYHQHHNGLRDRYKVRARRYVESNATFFEIKHKTHHNRTVKARLPISGTELKLTGEAVGFLGAHSPYKAHDLEPKLWNNYQRITLVSRARPERVTMDLNIEFGWGNATAALSGVVIVEVKALHPSQPSDIVPHLRALGLRPVSFSKYCAGVVLLYDHVKRNNFKPQMRKLEQLIREEGAYVPLA